MKSYSKEELIRELLKIKAMGWIRNRRPGNQGGVGNTVEDILGIEENNLPIPNASEWELKCQRDKETTSSLTTLFHPEPSPRAMKLVSHLLLPFYGWPHEEAGKKYPEDELSFRQTINGKSRTDRGFGIQIDYANRKVMISFDASAVSPRHKAWLSTVNKRIGLDELNPQPYWGFDDVFHLAGTKLKNCFYLKAKVKKEDGVEYFSYEKIYMLEKLDLDRFIKAIENDVILIDFDARTRHNHGTKYRMRPDRLPELYEKVKVIAE